MDSAGNGSLPMIERHSFCAYIRHVPHPPGELVELLWNAPDELVEMGKPLVRKRCVRATVLVRIGNRDYVVKRWVERSWRHALKQLVLPSRAARCWRDTLSLLKHGVSTPSPVAYREDRFGPFRGTSYYVYSYVPGRTLRDAHDASPSSGKLESDLASQAVRMWRQMGGARVSLSDPSLLNFIVDPTGRLWAIDLDKLRHHRSAYAATRGYLHSFDRFLENAPFQPAVAVRAAKAVQRNTPITCRAANNDSTGLTRKVPGYLFSQLLFKERRG